MYTKVTAIRHGRTESNANDLVSGGNDNPALVSEGIVQAREAAAKLRGTVNRVVSSPKDRCITTGRIVFGLPITHTQLRPDLNERYYGKFDGGPNDDWKAFMAEKQSELDGLSLEGQRSFNFGLGIENEAELITRAVGAFKDIARKSDGEPTGISTSGGILRGVLLGCGYELPTGSIDNLARLQVAYDTAGLHIIDHAGIHFPE